MKDDEEVADMRAAYAAAAAPAADHAAAAYAAAWWGEMAAPESEDGDNDDEDIAEEEYVSGSSSSDNGDSDTSMRLGRDDDSDDHSFENSEDNRDLETDENEEEDNTTCMTCGRGDNELSMLLCDGEGCNVGRHLFCLVPVLSQVPDGEWLCGTCDKPSSVEVIPRMTTTRQSPRTRATRGCDGLWPTRYPVAGAVVPRTSPPALAAIVARPEVHADGLQLLAVERAEDERMVLDDQQRRHHRFLDDQSDDSSTSPTSTAAAPRRRRRVNLAVVLESESDSDNDTVPRDKAHADDSQLRLGASAEVDDDPTMVDEEDEEAAEEEEEEAVVEEEEEEEEKGEEEDLPVVSSARCFHRLHGSYGLRPPTAYSAARRRRIRVARRKAWERQLAAFRPTPPLQRFT